MIRLRFKIIIYNEVKVGMKSVNDAGARLIYET